MENYLKYRETHGLKRRGGDDLDVHSPYLMVNFCLLFEIYTIFTLFGNNTTSFMEDSCCQLRKKVHTTWVTVNKHGGSTPRGKK